MMQYRSVTAAVWKDLSALGVWPEGAGVKPCSVRGGLENGAQTNPLTPKRDVADLKNKVRAASAFLRDIEGILEYRVDGLDTLRAKLSEASDTKAIKIISGALTLKKIAALKEREKCALVTGISADRAILLLNAYKLSGAHEEVARLYESSTDPEFTGSDLAQAAYVSALIRLNRLQDTVASCRRFLAVRPQDAEMWASLGSACLRMSREMRHRQIKKSADLLDAATASFQRAFLIGGLPYAGVKLLLCLAERGAKQELADLAPLVRHALDLAGGRRATNSWTLSWSLICDFVQGDTEAAKKFLPRVLSYSDKIWGLDSLSTDLKALRAVRRRQRGETSAFDAALMAIAGRRLELETLAPKAIPEALVSSPEVFGETPELAAVLDRGFSLQGLRSHRLPGNLKRSGLVHDELVTVRDYEDAQTLMTLTGLIEIEDFETWDQRVNALLETVYRLRDKRTGVRAMEDLKSAPHEKFAAVVPEILKRFAGDETRDGRTNLMVDAWLGVGDCRPVAHTKQLFYDVWKKNRVIARIRAADTALKRYDRAAYETCLSELEELRLNQLYVFDVSLRAEVAMDGKYNYRRDKRGRLIRISGVQDMENHTMNVLVRRDVDGGLVSTVIRDAFYHETFALERAPIDGREIASPRGFRVGEVDAYDETISAVVKVPVYAVPATYSRKRDVRGLDEFGGRRLRGASVGMPDYASLARMIASGARDDDAQSALAALLGRD